MNEGKSYIALVLPDLRLGGGQRVFLELARQFVASGHRVDIVSLTGDGELVAELPSGIGYRPLVNGRAHGGIRLVLKALPALTHYFREAQPDAILSSMTGANLLTVLARSRAGWRGRLVLREAASLSNTSGRMTRGLMRVIYPHADALLAVSGGVANDLERLGLDPSIIQVIHNPVDVERVRALAAQQAEPLPSFCDTPYIISIGRLTTQKDHGTLLRAYEASALRQTHRLIIVGEGKQRQPLAELVRKLGIEDRVELAGSIVNPYPILAGAALHVLSSRWEGYPNVLLEALALGVPVVATDCPAGPRELLRDGRYGRLAPVGDHVALARAMDDELRDPAGNGDEVIAVHQPQIVAQRYLTLLNGLDSEGRA
jgi:glycosyltransferase involved in cell wall biosynthesis